MRRQMLSRIRFWGAAALLAAGLWPARASAQAGGFVSSPAGGRVRAGDVVPLSWSVDTAGTADRDEMELVLSLDDGATFPIRVVARLTPSDAGTGWRVPALPTEHARLALRAGKDGAAETEDIVAVSDAFAITASRFESLERLYAVADEWRTGDALEGAPARSGDSGLAAHEKTPEVAAGERDRSEPETSPGGVVAPAESDEGRSMPAGFPERIPPAPARVPPAPLPLRL